MPWAVRVFLIRRVLWTMRISVITPVLNKVEFIERCFESVAWQSYKYFEHIIIDGGSHDGTVKLIEKYASGRPNVTWISKPDCGQSQAMNRGLQLARGNIIGFLNADDYYESDIFADVSHLLKSMETPSMLFGNCNILDDVSATCGVSKPSVLDIVEWLLPQGDEFIPVNPVQYFYTSDIHSLIGYFDESDHYTMDMDFLFRAIPVANCCYVD